MSSSEHTTARLALPGALRAALSTLVAVIAI
jgi:hypothetical protein